MREALTDLITSVGLLVEPFKSAREFLEHRRRDAPACLVLDVRLPGLSGLDLQRELVRTEAPIPIIFITGHGDIPMLVRAIKEGAVEFLAKPFRDRDLLDAIQHALKIDRAARQERTMVAEVRRRYESLTKRERQVKRLVLSGLLNKQIAGELGKARKAGRVASSTSFWRTRKDGFDVIQQKLVRDRTLPSGKVMRK